MPKRSKKAPDTDWARLEHIQNPPESGKGSSAKGGNMRVSPKLFCEQLDKIPSTACPNYSCRYWEDRRIILNCTLYNGSVTHIKACPERENK